MHLITQCCGVTSFIGYVGRGGRTSAAPVMYAERTEGEQAAQSEAERGASVTDNGTVDATARESVDRELADRIGGLAVHALREALAELIRRSEARGALRSQCLC
jgi:hypothetical protein